jgi:hypothetical protein
MTSLSESVLVACPPEVLYDLVSDVTRTGEWSPICEACWWDDGDGPRVGAHFTGRNVTPARTWETRSEVVAADPGREFAWVVGDAIVRWAYRLEAADGGTRLTETWELLPGAKDFFARKYGEQADAQLAERTQAARAGIPVTLQAIKSVAERENAPAS